MAQLNELKNGVNNKVIAEEERLKKRTNQVDGWMKRVEDRQLEVDKIILEGTQHLERKCFNGCCTKNCWSSYKLGKKVVKKLLLVENLKRYGVFEIALSLLRKDDVQILGLYGFGGFGKINLLKKINNDFDVIIWLFISSEVKIATVQEAIPKRLGLMSWLETVPLSSRASDFLNALKMKKFLILLDDIWEEIDLQSIRIPLPSNENKSKIVLSTRSVDVCGSMGAANTISN